MGCKGRNPRFKKSESLSFERLDEEPQMAERIRNNSHVPRIGFKAAHPVPLQCSFTIPSFDNLVRGACWEQNGIPHFESQHVLHALKSLRHTESPHILPGFGWRQTTCHEFLLGGSNRQAAPKSGRFCQDGGTGRNEG